MAKTCGIRLGRRRFEIVALEGSSKKPRVVAAIQGEIPASPDDPEGAAVAALKAALGSLRLKPDEVCLAVDSGLAAFRNVTLPFEHEDKIEQVLKFEIESQLPQWDIDDVVVDFHVLSSTGVESHLLVTAVRKDDLWGPLRACERAGMEATETELEATAVVNAAAAAGAFHADSAEVLVHVGESSTTLAVIDSGKLRSLRALHLGALLSVDASAGSDDGVDGAGADLDGVAPAAIAERSLDEIAARIRREIVRAVTAASTANPLRAILLCGHTLPGLEGDEVQDIAIERFDPIPEDAVVPEGDRGAFAAAYGAALGRMGGGIVTARLRREELKFTGTLERLELPLAVVATSVILILALQLMISIQKSRSLSTDMETWVWATNNYMLGVPSEGRSGIMRHPPEDVSDYALGAHADLLDGTSEKSAYEHLLTIKARLAAEVSSLERKLGRDGAITHPQSALEAAAAVLAVIDDLDGQIGRFSIRALNADYRRGVAQRTESCEVRLDMSFFSESGSQAASQYDALLGALRSMPWCEEATDAPTKAFDVGNGISADGIKVIVDTKKIERAASAGATAAEM